MLAQNYLAGLNPTYWQFWLGLLLVGAVLFARGGVLGGVDRVRGLLRRWRAP
jgi:branched-chain amino acid transport system permease protein